MFTHPLEKHRSADHVLIILSITRVWCHANLVACYLKDILGASFLFQRTEWYNSFFKNYMQLQEKKYYSVKNDNNMHFFHLGNFRLERSLQCKFSITPIEF